MRTFRLIAGAVAAPTEDETRAAHRRSRVRGRVAGALTPASVRAAPRACWAASRFRPRTPARVHRDGPAGPQHPPAAAADRHRAAIDGVWDAHTEHAFQQVCKVLGIAPERTTRTYRIIAGASAARTPAERSARRGGRRGRRQAAARRRAATVVLGGPRCRRTSRARLRRLPAACLNDWLVGSARRPARVDGKWGAHTDRAFRRVCRCWGSRPRATSGPTGSSPARSRPARRRNQAGGRGGVDYEQQAARLVRPPGRAAAAPHKPPGPKPDRPEPPEPAHAGDAELAPPDSRHRGHYEQEILAASRKTGASGRTAVRDRVPRVRLPNVFGRDGVASRTRSAAASSSCRSPRRSIASTCATRRTATTSRASARCS